MFNNPDIRNRVHVSEETFILFQVSRTLKDPNDSVEKMPRPYDI